MATQNVTSPAGWQSCLAREVAVGAPNCQNDLPVPLTRDRGAPRTQRDHPATRVALSTRVEQVSPSIWLFTPSPRRRDTGLPTSAGCAGGSRHLVQRFLASVPCLGSLTWVSAVVSARAGHYHAFEQPAEPQHAAASGARRAVLAALGDAAAPFRWHTCSMDGGASCRLLVGLSRLVLLCHG